MSIKEWVDRMTEEAEKALLGQRELLHLIICCMLVEGHILLEGVPGLGKTLAARIFAILCEGSFSRIQFTPDLMPTDITGSSIFDFNSREFHIRKGPIFNNIVLADEINRTAPKTQAALLEAMQEKTVTIDAKTLDLPAPFMVIATQNPLEFQGTYPLPESQLDRFTMKIIINYPAKSSERDLLEKVLNQNIHVNLKDRVKPVVTIQQMQLLKEEIKQIHVQDRILDYIFNLIDATRNHRFLILGASPRAAISLASASRVWAAMNGRDYVIPEDIEDIIHPVIRHRLLLLPDAEMEGITTDRVISDILNNTAVPR